MSRGPTGTAPAGSLLAVFAHPDDESLASGGLLAACADQGASARLLCLTHGELGGEGPPETVKETRRQELRQAAHVLGLDEVVLREHEDGMLPWLEAATLEADILEVTTRLRPDVVVTFDMDGLYGHPDHVAVHERTTAALTRLGDDSPALYYVTMPAGRMRALVEHVARSVGPGPAGGSDLRQILGVTEVDAFGGDAPSPTLILDTTDYATRKLKAICCHRSQVGDSALCYLAEQDAARFLGTECYRRAAVGAGRPGFIDAFAVPSP